jgi:hypothetical protein
MDELLKILGGINTFNESADSALKLVAAIRHPDGTLTVVETLDQADAIFKENEDQARAWLDAHPQQ